MKVGKLNRNEKVERKRKIQTVNNHIYKRIDLIIIIIIIINDEKRMKMKDLECAKHTHTYTHNHHRQQDTQKSLFALFVVI